MDELLSKLPKEDKLRKMFDLKREEKMKPPARNTLKVLKVECSDKSIETDIVIISFHFGNRDYRKIYFSKSLYTKQLADAKGDRIKKDSK